MLQQAFLQRTSIFRTVNCVDKNCKPIIIIRLTIEPSCVMFFMEVRAVTTAVTTKERLLSLLESQKGTYFSGEEIAEKLAVSRTSVWKAVNSLRNEGYEIDAVQNRGYCLSVDTDMLSAQGIRKYLQEACAAMQLHVLPTVPSTNSFLREKAAEGAAEGYVVVSGTQTAGRGRFGRTFYSPADTGIYLSVLFRPENLVPGQAVKLTTMAAVAVCEAIEEVAGKTAGIKWVNDIYMDGRKVCGILTEASVSIENGLVEYLVLGIGINVYPPADGFPEELRQVAGAVFQERQSDGKNRLVAAVLNRLMQYYKTGSQAGYEKKYRDRSIVIGKPIDVLSPTERKKAVALDVDENCCLLVQYEDKTVETLSSGEISIRLSQEMRDKR